MKFFYSKDDIKEVLKDHFNLSPTSITPIVLGQSEFAKYAANIKGRQVMAGVYTLHAGKDSWFMPNSSTGLAASYNKIFYFYLKGILQAVVVPDYDKFNNNPILFDEVRIGTVSGLGNEGYAPLHSAVYSSVAVTSVFSFVAANEYDGFGLGIHSQSDGSGGTLAFNVPGSMLVCNVIQGDNISFGFVGATGYGNIMLLAVPRYAGLAPFWFQMGRNNPMDPLSMYGPVNGFCDLYAYSVLTAPSLYNGCSRAQIKGYKPLYNNPVYYELDSVPGETDNICMIDQGLHLQMNTVGNYKVMVTFVGTDYNWLDWIYQSNSDMFNNTDVLSLDFVADNDRWSEFTAVKVYDNTGYAPSYASFVNQTTANLVVQDSAGVNHYFGIGQSMNLTGTSFKLMGSFASYHLVGDNGNAWTIDENNGVLFNLPIPNTGVNIVITHN